MPATFLAANGRFVALYTALETSARATIPGCVFGIDVAINQGLSEGGLKDTTTNPYAFQLRYVSTALIYTDIVYKDKQSV